jgi:hypothetical protein
MMKHDRLRLRTGAAPFTLFAAIWLGIVHDELDPAGRRR